MKRTAIIIFFLQAVCVQAQDLSGTWRGKLTQGPGGCFPVYFIEVQLKMEGGKVYGSTYHFSDVSNFVKERFEGVYDAKSKSLSLFENGVLDFRIPADCIPCIKKYALDYARSLDAQVLKGDWGGKMMNTQTPCPSGKVVLTKEDASIFNEIKVDTGEIKLDFYDNAQLDGDTISVTLDNKPVVSKQRLSTRPLTVFVKMEFSKLEHEVVMIAHNEGTIPPNTALLIVTAGEKKYRLFLSSDDDQKKIMVRFIYEKPHQ
ncbi:MAG: hypothetical protein C4308_03165 [Chitinophagaceae bacterium]